MKSAVGLKFWQRHKTSSQAGSASVLSIFLIALLVTLAVGVGCAGLLLISHRHVETAADLVALAGATAAQAGELACPAAARIAIKNQVVLQSCEENAGMVAVRVKTKPLKWLQLTVTARAVAGPVGYG